jgi:hypothetical protein
METTAFFERKIALTPKELHSITKIPIEELLTKKLRDSIEKKCTEHGFVLPGSIKLLSRSMGYFESGRFTGETVYFVKAESRVINSVDGVIVNAEVIRKNKMGIYAVHRDAIRILVPRDLHIGNTTYDNINIGDKIDIELKASKSQVNDTFIFATGIHVSSKWSKMHDKHHNMKNISDDEGQEEQEQEQIYGAEETKEE